MKKESLKGFKPYQYDGCGCVWYEKGKQERLVKCDLHKKDPRAFGGLLVSIKNLSK